MIREAIAALVDGVELSREQARTVMNEIMSGECTDAQIGSFLTALRLKGETVGEIAGCAEVMREKATLIRAPEGCIDTCGTGGDSLHTFNISTAAALVAAGAGVTVAKHGNRSVSSTSGSADVLQALGVNVDAPPSLVEQCLAEAGIGFLFAPRMHGAMKHAIGPRREMGIRTVFNILGPLTNPAGAKRQLVGVYDPALAPVLAEVLGALGSERALVVHGHDGLDEISISGETTVAELAEGRVTTRTLTPEEAELEPAPLAALQVSSAEESAARIRGVLDGEHGPSRAITLLNAGAAIYVAGKASGIAEGVRVAAEAIDSGAARTALDRLAALSERRA